MKKQNQLWQSAKKAIALTVILMMSATASAQTSQTHIVKRGETFASIASKYGISESELRTANPNAKNCYAGTKLTIVKKEPPKNMAKSSTAATSSGNGGGAAKLMLLSARFNIDDKKYKKATKAINFVLSNAQSTEQQKEEARELLAVVEKAKEERREKWNNTLDNLSNGLKETGQSLMAISMAANQMSAAQRTPRTPAPFYNNPTPRYGSNTTQQIQSYQQRPANNIVRQGIEDMNNYTRQVIENNRVASSNYNSYSRAAEIGKARAEQIIAEVEQEVKKKREPYNKGLAYYNAGNYTEAFKWIEQAAEAGIVDAQYKLGDMYALGKGVEKNETIANRWYRRAEENTRSLNESIRQNNEKSRQTNIQTTNSAPIVAEKKVCKDCNGTRVVWVKGACFYHECVEVLCNICGRVHCIYSGGHKRCPTCDGRGEY